MTLKIRSRRPKSYTFLCYVQIIYPWKFGKNPTTGSQYIMQIRKCHADTPMPAGSTQNQCPPPRRFVDITVIKYLSAQCIWKRNIWIPFLFRALVLTLIWNLLTVQHWLHLWGILDIFYLTGETNTLNTQHMRTETLVLGNHFPLFLLLEGVACTPEKEKQHNNVYAAHTLDMGVSRYFSYFSEKTSAEGIHFICFAKLLLMSTHNMFCRAIRW